MLDVAALRAVFNEKLQSTDSMDAAFTKAVWVAYQAGLADAPIVRGVEVAAPREELAP